jgi:gliding motility-associated-like protein
VTYKDLCGNKGPNSNFGKNIVLDGIQYVSHYDLNWNSYEQWDDGVQEYIIQYYNELTNTYEAVTHVSSTDTTYIDSYLTKDGVDTIYCYRVVAINAADQNIKSYSNTRCFIPVPKNYFPNAFSPNDDDLNETFKYKGQFAKKLNTEIYNRWGNLVYSSDETEFEWDGKNENTGEACPQGTYIFRYELTGYDGTIISDNMLIYLLK